MKMHTVTVNANTQASSVSPYILVSILSAEKASEPVRIPSPRATDSITGPLPGGKWLTRPLTVTIKYDDEEVIVSEPRFHIHAVGSTKTEALVEFKHILSEELDDLIADEEQLGPRLLAELDYLRNLIRMA